MTASQIDILLVDDDPNDVDLDLHALRTHNLANAIHVARDGEEALEYLFCTGRYADRPAIPPGVVLLDLNLPKVNGLEVLKQIRASPILNSLPVVILTSSAEQRDIVESYNLGVNSYITKPVDFEGFTEAVRAIGFYWILLNQPPPPPPPGSDATTTETPPRTPLPHRRVLVRLDPRGRDVT